MQTILVTGFEPFVRYTENPTWACVNALPDSIHGIRIEKHRLPVEYDRCAQMLEALLETYRPSAVLNLGLAGGSNCIVIERMGLNLQDSSMPDNAGTVRLNTLIRADGWDGYFTTLPHAAIKARLASADIQVEYSTAPGFYVCNTAIYISQYRAHVDMPGMRTGFMHLPLADGQDEGMCTMPLEKLQCAVRLAVEVLAAYLNE